MKGYIIQGTKICNFGQFWVCKHGLCLLELVVQFYGLAVVCCRESSFLCLKAVENIHLIGNSCAHKRTVSPFKKKNPPFIQSTLKCFIWVP